MAHGQCDQIGRFLVLSDELSFRLTQMYDAFWAILKTKHQAKTTLAIFWGMMGKICGTFLSISGLTAYGPHFIHA